MTLPGKKDRDRPILGRALKIGELFAILAIICVLAMVLLPTLALAPTHGALSCQNNLKQIGICLMMYAVENGGAYPRMHGDEAFGTAGNLPLSCCDYMGCTADSGIDICDDADLTFDMRAMFPDYFADIRYLVCPLDTAADELTDPLRRLYSVDPDVCPYAGQPTDGDLSYFYLGWFLDKVGKDAPTVPANTIGLLGTDPVNAQVAGLLAAILPVLGDRTILNDGILDEDVVIPPDIVRAAGGGPIGNGNTNTLFRLRENLTQYAGGEGVDSGAIEPAKIPVMFDRIPVQGGTYHHPGRSCYVLYLDGHADLAKYRAPFSPARTFTPFVNLLQ